MFLSGVKCGIILGKENTPTKDGRAWYFSIYHLDLDGVNKIESRNYMNCIYFKRRSKNYKYYLYCNKFKKEITFDNCKCCEFKEYKERKPIKKVSKKRITVSKETYEIVYNESKGRCALCNNIDNLQLHHILYRSERKDLIDEPSNCVMLCHQDFSKNKCHGGVHNNKKKYQPMLLEIKQNLTIL